MDSDIQLRQIDSDGLSLKLAKLMRLRLVLEELAVGEVVNLIRENASLCAKLDKLARPLVLAVRQRDYSAFSIADRKLHEGLVELADVPGLPAAYAAAWESLAEFHRNSLQAHWPELRMLLREHEFLLEAIRSGDAEMAADAVRGHLDAVHYHLGDAPSKPGSGSEALRRAVAHITLYPHHNLKLQDVAQKVAYLSPGHLSRLFRESYGMGFQAYLQTIRMGKASTLLEETTLSVAQIARRTGYTDVSRFCMHFKRRFDMSPSQWRRR